MATSAQIIAAIDDYFLAVANGSKVKSYSIGGKSLENYSIADLQRIRAANVAISNRTNDTSRVFRGGTRFER
jgi:hypothetical protein